MRPVSMSSCARAAPMSRGSSQLVPMSQAERPMRMNAALNFAGLGGDADVGAEHERESAAGRRAVHRGDDRLRQRPQVRDERGDVLLHGESRLGRAEALGVGRAPVAAEVEAGAEAPALHR